MATREQYNKCMVPYMKGTGVSKEERHMKFCVGAKLCSGKASSEKEAIGLCSLPKEPKPGKTPKKARAAVNPCVQDVTARVASGELPADTDVADVCAEIPDQEPEGIKVKIGNRKKILSIEEFERICPCAVKGE